MKYKISRISSDDPRTAGCPLQISSNEPNRGKVAASPGVRRLPGLHDDWLICMISSQLSQEVPDFDEVISEKDDDFTSSGLKQASVIRIARLAVVEPNILIGAIGEVSCARLSRIKGKLSDWLIGR